jgi:transcription antitermination factor NusA-like protein
MKNYANAKDVLPKKLFEEVKKHYTGMLYIPEGIRPQEKRKLAIALHSQGTGVKEIASIVGLSVRRITQIISEERDRTRF